MEEKKDIIKRIIKSGAEISGGIGGALLGVIIPGTEGLLLGGGAAPILTNVFKSIGSEIESRYLSTRETTRIGAAYTFALDKIIQNENSGLVLRNDDFFQNSHSNRPASEEILESILMSAQRESEELKIKYLGNLYANICFHPEISRAHANQLIKNANVLSFRQFCLLQLLYEKSEDFQALKAPNFRINGKSEIAAIDIISETRDLQQRGLVSIQNTKDGGNFSTPIPLTRINITHSGVNFSELLCLNEIEKETLQELNEITEIK